MKVNNLLPEKVIFNKMDEYPVIKEEVYHIYDWCEGSDVDGVERLMQLELDNEINFRTYIENDYVGVYTNDKAFIRDQKLNELIG